MTDIATIGAALSSLKTATDIVAFLRQGDLSLQRAELKLKLAELISALADTKIELIDLQETLAKKDKRIEELEAAFQNKDALMRQFDAYYNLNEKGDPIGPPFCVHCWENEYKKRQLVNDAKDFRTNLCTLCGHKYAANLTYSMQAASEG